MNNSFSKQLQSRELITQNKIGHESRLIQFFTHEHEKILLSLIAIHELGKIQITIHQEKNRLSILHVKSISALLSITEADSEQVLLISSNI